ncbi:hypothetical protein LTR95_011212 [Oleoguttula sp. CCFEE 5521]
MDAFEYEPLTAEDNVRLLRVDRLRPDESLQCSILQVNRRELPAGIKYTALSYRWGDLDEKGALQIRSIGATSAEEAPYNRKTLPMATLEMLKDMYHNGWIAKTWIWIDYLCLNQADLGEKNVQVKLMGTVYELAEKVIVYAGPERPDTGLAVTFWNQLHSVFERLPHRDGDGKWIHLSYNTVLNATNTKWKGPKWIALLHLFLRPWFGRLWTIQEAVLPAHVIFVWGRFSLTWAEVARFEEWERRANISTFISSGDKFWIVSKTIMALCYLRSNRAGMKKGWRCSLSGAISSCDGAEAADPRDRIYGLLGLLFGPGSDLGITPEYSESNTAKQVYTEATRNFTLTSDSFDVLYFAGIGWPRYIYDLPSWVPDYSRSLSGSPGTHLTAGKGPVPCTIKALESQGDDLTLQLIIVDRIAAVQDFGQAPDITISSHDASADPYTSWYLRSAIQLLCQRHSLPWSASFVGAFWRTLTNNTAMNVDKSDGDSPAPAYYGNAFTCLDTVAEMAILAQASSQQSTQVEKERLLSAILGSGYEHAVCVSDGGDPMLAPRKARRGDVIAVALGARAPFVLRPTNDLQDGKRVYRLVGTCYVHALNEGIHFACSRGRVEEVILRVYAIV